MSYIPMILEFPSYEDVSAAEDRLRSQLPYCSDFEQEERVDVLTGKRDVAQTYFCVFGYPKHAELVFVRFPGELLIRVLGEPAFKQRVLRILGVADCGRN